MNQHQAQITLKEFQMYLYGFITIIGLFILSILFAQLTTPYNLLVFRLSMLGVGTVYFICIYFYYSMRFKTSIRNDQLDQMIIIVVNGKEYRL